jgi:hypothetical protein
VRSVVLYDIPAGRALRLFDSPVGNKTDDWTEIIAKLPLNHVQLDSFERSFENTRVRVVYHRNNGLDGKVSRVEYAAESSGPLVELYEGNAARQNIVCTLDASRNQTVNFAAYPCDNDEARSLRLYDMPAGRVIRLFDSPDGKHEDDWIEIEILRPIAQYTLSTFERSVRDSSLRATYFRNNGLDQRSELGNRSHLIL